MPTFEETSRPYDPRTVRGYSPANPIPQSGLPPPPPPKVTQTPVRGGLKYDQGKPQMDLLDSVAIEQLAEVLTFGANKYAGHNWRQGIKTSRLIAAMLRHIFAFMKGENNDPESGLPHIAHAMCCCMFILGLNAPRPDMDDRYKGDTND